MATFRKVHTQVVDTHRDKDNECSEKKKDKNVIIMEKNNLECQWEIPNLYIRLRGCKSTEESNCRCCDHEDNHRSISMLA